MLEVDYYDSAYNQKFSCNSRLKDKTYRSGGVGVWLCLEVVVNFNITCSLQIARQGSDEGSWNANTIRRESNRRSKWTLGSRFPRYKAEDGPPPFNAAPRTCVSAARFLASHQLVIVGLLLAGANWSTGQIECHSAAHWWLCRQPIHQ